MEKIVVSFVYGKDSCLICFGMWKVTVPSEFTMISWLLLEVIVHHITLLLDGKRTFKLATCLSQRNQDMKDYDEEIEDFIVFDQNITVHMKATHHSYDSVWKTMHKELHISKVPAGWIPRLLTYSCFLILSCVWVI